MKLPKIEILSDEMNHANHKNEIRLDRNENSNLNRFPSDIGHHRTRAAKIFNNHYFLTKIIKSF